MKTTKYKKCPYCKGKGKIRTDSLGRTKEENKKEAELWHKMEY
jgi:hypothetical protein